MRIALAFIISLTALAPSVGEAQGRTQQYDVVPFGSGSDPVFHPNLEAARRLLDEHYQYVRPGLYPMLDAELSQLEDQQTISDWILWPGSALGVGTSVLGLALLLSAGDDDDQRVAGGATIGVGLIVLLGAMIGSAVVRPTEDDVRGVFAPVLNPVR